MVTALQSEKKHGGAIAGYMPVQVEMLRRLEQTPVDLFIQYERGKDLVLYHGACCPLESTQTSRLTETGVRQIYVRTDQFQDFASHLLETIEVRAEHEPVPAGERYAALQMAMAVEIEHAARLMDCGPYVAVAEKLGKELTSLLVGNNVLPNDLYCLARHDFNTFRSDQCGKLRRNSWQTARIVRFEPIRIARPSSDFARYWQAIHSGEHSIETSQANARGAGNH